MPEALYAHFWKASHDAEHSANGRCMFQGLATKLSSGDFIKNIGLMLDALEELKDLSESLQSRDISLSRAVHLVEREVDTFSARQHNPGQYYRQASEALETGTFYGVTLQKDSTVKTS